MFILFYYFVCGAAQIPMNVFSVNFQEVRKSSGTIDFSLKRIKQYAEEGAYVEIKMSLIMCCTLHLTIIGSFLFIFIAGYGLAYTPMEYLNAFLNRPQIVKKIFFFLQ